MKPRQRAQVCLRTDHRTRAEWDLCRVFARELNPGGNIHMGPAVFKAIVSREYGRLWKELKRRGIDPTEIERQYRERLYGPPTSIEEHEKFHGVGRPVIDDLPGLE